MDAAEEKAPWDMLVLDTMSFMPKSENGYRFILAMLDVASRWLELLPLRSKDPLELAFAVEQHVFLSFGPPSSILYPSSRPEFEGSFPKILKKYQVTKFPLEQAHSHLQTTASRCFKGAKKSLLLMKREYPTVPWDHLLKHVSYKHRTRRHSNMTCSPQKMLLGFRKEQKTEKEDAAMIDEKTKETSTIAESITIGAARDNHLALKQERDWFQTNLDRFGGLSLSLKAEALRSKMMLDPSALPSFDGDCCKTSLHTTKSPWSGVPIGERHLK